MAGYSRSAETNITLIRESSQTDQFGYRIVFFLWILFLFEPARLLAHYIPILEPLKWLPTLVLLVAIFHWIRSPLKKYNYRWFTIFLMINLFGTAIAFVWGNWGIARQINRQILQFYMLGILTLTYFNEDERVHRLFLLYFLYILFFALWGILSLKITPLDPSVDPGLRKIVPWHHWLDNRDGFGPLMVIGLAYCFYYYSAVENRNLKKVCLICFILCLAGIVSSFGRGVFVAMGVTVLFVWVQTGNKFRNILLIIGGIGLIFVVESIISPGDLYWEKMRTIEEGTSEGTGLERSILWGVAWREFLDNPIFGVGTGNFGIAITKVVSPEEAIRYGYSSHGKLWGKALHCGPMTILCEYGLVGAMVFVFLIIDFLKANIASRRILLGSLFEEGGSSTIRNRDAQGRIYYFMSLGLNASFVAFWANGFFYEIIYASFLWNIIAINRLIYIRLLVMKNAILENPSGG